MDIKETKELLNGLKLLAIAGRKIGADGKVSLLDLPALAVLAKDGGQILEAFKGVDMVDDEIKDLSVDEAKELLAEILKIASEVKAAE